MLAIITSVWLAGVFLSMRMESIIRENLRSQMPPSMMIDFKTLNISLLKRLVTVVGVCVQLDPMAHAGQHTLYFDELKATDIKIWPLLWKKQLTIGALNLRKGQLHLEGDVLKDWKAVTSSFDTPGKKQLSSITLDEVTIDSLSCMMRSADTSSCTSPFEWKTKNLSLTLTDVALSGHDSIQFSVRMMALHDVQYSRELYTYKLAQIRYHSGTFQADSFMMQPRFPKTEFAHQLGRQTDCITFSTQRIQISGFDIDDVVNRVFNATAIRIERPRLHSFRDKQLPFIKHHDVPMPVALFQSLPFAVKVDSLIIENGHIVYEEMHDTGRGSGAVSFHHLNAHFTSLNNRPQAGDDAMTLEAEARFMDAGRLQASFRFPLDSGGSYHAKGSLTGFDLTSLNPVVQPLANLQIESGVMNAMYFNFDYNATASAGDLLIQYEDLKLKSLANDGSLVDKVVSLLLNVVIRTNKDDVKKESRSGVVSFQRDTRRSIFNYWWKSLASGIRSSYNLDKVLGKSDK